MVEQEVARLLAQRYEELWKECQSSLTDEIAWRVSRMGKLWNEAGEQKKERIVNYCAYEQAIMLFNSEYLGCPRPEQEPFVSWEPMPLHRNPLRPRLPKPTDRYAQQTGKGKGQLMRGQEAERDDKKDQLEFSSCKISEHDTSYPGGDKYPDDASSIAASIHKWSIPQPPPFTLLLDPYP